jgi:hypothetical protein
VVSIKNVQGDGQAKQYDVKLRSALMAYDFFLVTDEAAAKLRRQKAEEATAGLGRKFRSINDLLVPNVVQ